MVLMKILDSDKFYNAQILKINMNLSGKIYYVIQNNLTLQKESTLAQDFAKIK